MQNRARIEQLVTYAQGILSRIVETFPTYTLHDDPTSTEYIKYYGAIARKEGKEFVVFRVINFNTYYLLSRYWYGL